MGTNIGLKDRSDDVSQQFFYDPKNSCIRLQGQKTKCLDIEGGS
jgi:hypothetical protein